tara:strand:+ start:2291 stop:3385 length:1095 start_codon:yes stop_codon:yes gene_type:complete
MKPKILIIGSTGKLGIKILNFCSKKKIDIFCITGFKNNKLLKIQSKKYSIKNFFLLSDKRESLNFQSFLIINKIDIIYFLDYGYKSLLYSDIFLQNNKNSQIAIANKEMIIAGGDTLINKIYSTKNKFIPLDSEHFSLLNTSFNNDNIKKIYITASGGPFYYKKNINLNKVSLKSVLAHPKWKMGVNNSIDSSNFINKILEIYELSIIFKIDLLKIDFLISQNAYVHSIILNRNNIVNLNCFNNDMLITLVNPLLRFYPFIDLKINNYFLNNNMLKLEKFNDRRFKINKYIKMLKFLSPHKQITFMILNNIAQKKYLSSEIKYNEILDFIMTNLKINNKFVSFKSIKDRLNFITSIEKYYEHKN